MWTEEQSKEKKVQEFQLFRTNKPLKAFKEVIVLLIFEDLFGSVE